MRAERLIESQSTILELDQSEAAALDRAGRRLASTKSWWGDTSPGATDRSVIRCQPTSSGKWRVRVQDAVGIISVGQLQLIVEPKIPQEHLLYLLAAGGHIPRMDDERGRAAGGESLWQLVAQWYVTAAERVLRRDLLRDYAEEAGFLSAKRGRVVALPTARAFYSGRMGFECQYEEFTVDTPLNRLLKAAAVAVLGSPLLPRSVRRRAQAVRARMATVGDLQHGDLMTTLERRSGYYADAIQLARQILRSQGRIIASGELSAWTFLIRTPEVVEDGVRHVLEQRLGIHWPVTKRGIRVDAGITFTPDLVFCGGQVVADVKYKLLKSDWLRSDLYQIVAFGTAFHATHGAILGFRHHDQDTLPRALQIGSLKVTCLSWPADPSLSPETAAAALSDDVETWLTATQQTREQLLTAI